MVTSGLFVVLDAKPGKQEELAAFLKQGLALANAEVTTPVWFAVRFSASRFAIFDAFRDEAGRQAHLDRATTAHTHRYRRRSMSSTGERLRIDSARRAIPVQTRR